MFEIRKPFPLKELALKPDPSAMFRLEEVITQTISALLGWDGETRKLLTCSLSGALNTISPQVKGIKNVVSTGGNEVITFAGESTSEVIVLAKADNTGDVWVNIDSVPAVDTGFPLDAGDSIILSINNLQSLQLFVVTSGDKIIVLHTV